MTEIASESLIADEFLAWAIERPDHLRWELVQGKPIAMAPEDAGHGRAKLRFALRLDEAVKKAALLAEVFGGGMAVQVDEATVYAPDVLLRCGAALPDDAIKVQDPLIVVEVISPASRSRDFSARLADYFRMPSLRHYVVVRTHDRTLVHYSRAECGQIISRIVDEGRIDFSGLLVLDEVFPPVRS